MNNLTLDKIKYFCKMNTIVYMEEEGILRSYDGDEKITELKFMKNDNSGAQCICCLYDKNTIVVCFRGSDQVIDWINNFKAFQVELPSLNDRNVLIHDGFYDTYVGVKNDIIDYVKEQLEQNPDIENILCTGHSAGGAQSELCLMELATLYPGKNFSSLTFGSPRTGNKQFSQCFKTKCNEIYHFVNGHDPVPHLPTSLRFKNTDSWYYINRQNKIKKKDFIFWCVCTDLTKQSIDEHHPGEYVRAINNIETFNH